jgi:hypothetical protein
MCCSGSSQYAIGCQLLACQCYSRNMAGWSGASARGSMSHGGMHTQLKGLAFLEDLE